MKSIKKVFRGAMKNFHKKSLKDKKVDQENHKWGLKKKCNNKMFNKSHYFKENLCPLFKGKKDNQTYHCINSKT